jgi:hypothetical protein
MLDVMRWALPFLCLAACAKLASLEPTSGTGATTTEVRDAGGLPETAEKITTSFGDIERPAPCGQTTEFRYVVLTSANTAPIPYALEVPEGAPFDLRVDGGPTGRIVEGQVPPDGEVKVYVRVTAPRPGPVGSDLFIRTGSTRQKTELSVTVQGGKLVLKPALIDFGDVRKETESAPQPVTLTNEGTEPVTITSWAPADPDFIFAPSGLSIEPGQTGAVTATLRAGPTGTQLERSFTPASLTPMCEGAPSVVLRATRVNTDVTVNPLTIAFGDVSCNTAAPPRTVTITNYSSQIAQFTVSLPGGDASWFTVSTTGGSVPRTTGGTPGTSTFTIGLKPGGDLSPHSESVIVSITSPDQSTKSITASVQFRGAILSVTPLSGQSFPLTFTAANQTRSYVMQNVGNAGIRVRAATTAPFTPDQPPYQSAVFSFPVQVNVKSGTDGNAAGSITFTRIDDLLFGSAQLCNTPTVPVRSQF